MADPGLNIGQDYEKQYGFHDKEKYVFKSKRGLTREIVEEISWMKSEPDWMRQYRLRALDAFNRKPLPAWADLSLLSKIQFDNIYYYLKPTNEQGKTWEEVPAEIKNTFDKLGIPEAERKFLAGVTAQYESEVVYHSLHEDLKKQGVIFLGMDDGLKQYPELVQKYFGTLIPAADNKFSALNSAVWSGGCLTKNARVFTTNPGLKSIAEIKQGDSVYALSDEGTIVPAKVSAMIHSGRKPVYRFRAGGRTVEATKNHMFLTLQKTGTPTNGEGRRWVTRWKPLAELGIGSLVAVAKKIPHRGESRLFPGLAPYLKNHHLQRGLRAPHKSNRDIAWLMGVWVGDGSMHTPHPHMCFINFALPKGDLVRAEAKRIVQKLFNYTVKTENTDSFTINSKALGAWLKTVGFYGKAKTKRVPEWVFGLPEEERLAFVGGLLDTDGWVENEGKTVRFELANEKLVEDIKMLAISCGIYSDGKVLCRKRKAAFFKNEKRSIHSGISYSCRLTGSIARIATRNPKKRRRLDGAEKHTSNKYTTVTGENCSSASTEHLGFAPIREMQYAGITDVYDIQVDGPANFLANGIVAHNSFIYVPKGVQVAIPLQAYFRINAENMGQFERTLIIADEGSSVHYVEGCTAPVYSSDSLHSAVVELVALPHSHIRYTTIQNWSKNVYNLVTKRAIAHENSIVEWLDGNLGSKLTMKYPAVYLVGRKARGEVVSVAFSGKDQHQDAGAKMVHAAPETSSMILSKSISKDGGRTSYRGLVKVYPDAENVKSSVRCDALLMDDISRSDTYPTMEIDAKKVRIEHEATVSKVGEEEIFYLMSRGLKEQEATTMIVNGFFEAFVKELPLEYAVELNRLVQLEMEGSVG